MNLDLVTLRALGQTVHELTQLDVAWVDAAGNPGWAIAAHRVPDALGLAPGDWTAVRALVTDGGSCAASTAGRLEYVIVRADQHGADGYLVAGPFRTVAPTLAEIHELMVDLEIPLIERVPLTTLYESLPVVGSHFSRSLGSAMEALVETAHRPAPQTFFQAKKTKTQGVVRESWTSDQQEIEARYRAEAALRHLVATGNRELYERFIASTANDLRLDDRIANNPLRSAKNITFVLNSILRLAAEEGGLHPVHRHHISSRYAAEIEACRTATEVNLLQGRMTLDYIDAVRNQQTGRLTAGTRRVVDHLALHLQDDLSATGVAAALGLTPRGLANRFRRELSTTLTAYVQGKRVSEAAWLLESTTLSIKEIAGLVGFADPNHFSRVFRQVRGKSPREARVKREVVNESAARGLSDDLQGGG